MREHVLDEGVGPLHRQQPGRTPEFTLPHEPVNISGERSHVLDPDDPLALFPAGQWASPSDGGRSRVTVAMCGDDATALSVVGELVRDVGGIPAALGALDRARWLEEVAGFVMGLALTGFDPDSAVPQVPSLNRHTSSQG